MFKKKSLLRFIVPSFVFVAGFVATMSSFIFTIGEPRLPKKFDQ